MNRRSFVSAGVLGIVGISGCQDNASQNGTPTSTEEPDSTTAETSQKPTATAESGDSPTEDSAITSTDEPEDGPIGPRNEDELPPDPDPTDGYPPEFDKRPDERSIDPETFERISVDPRHVEGSDEETDVTLAPIEAVYYWYARGEARFVDARSKSMYELAHVYGSVANYALDDTDSAIEEWPEGDRIVCYCGCPHALSSIRAATLLEAGYEEVYVLDEGFGEWHTRGYPMAGSNVEERPAEYLIEGMTDPSSAGKVARVSHEPTGQRSAGSIGSDGTYTVEINFDDLSVDSLLSVETPEYRVETTLGNAITGVEPPGH